MSNIETIQALIEGLTAKEIKAIMSKVASKKPTRVDTSRKLRSMAITDLYFSVAPVPHKTTFEEYKMHAEGIRQQVLSGVDL